MNRFIAASIIALTISCVDRENTHTGDRTFSCNINGKFFTPKHSSMSPSPNSNGLSFFKTNKDKDLDIHASNNENNTTVSLYIKDYKVGSFPLGDSDGQVLPYAAENNQATVFLNGKTYLSKSNQSGNIVITTISDNDIKGTFDLTLYNKSNPSDLIKVTNGKFDD